MQDLTSKGHSGYYKNTPTFHPTKDNNIMAYGANHMNLKAFSHIINAFPSDTVVRFDNYSYPGMPHSYRGYYGDLSFDQSSTPITVGEMKDVFHDILGQMFTGWKGGEFYYNGGSYLWGAKHGETGPMIVGVLLEDGELVIMLEEDNW